jgi:hypothetical protein
VQQPLETIALEAFERRGDAQGLDGLGGFEPEIEIGRLPAHGDEPRSRATLMGSSTVMLPGLFM